MSQDLKELRSKIDEADAELISAFKKRFEITEGIGEYKAQTGTDLFCPEREEEKIEGLNNALGEYAYADYITDLFRDIMDYSKIQQSRNIFGDKDIYLIGMPGCGKSLIGKILSQKLFRDFTDLDELFEKEYGATPADIIENKGEASFRDMETALLKKVSDSKRKDKKKCFKARIISCGGGIVVRDENKEFLKKNSFVVYIKRNLEKLSSKGRPLSKNVGIEKLYEQRAEKYEGWSDFTADNNKNPEFCVDEILSEMKKRNKEE